MQTIKVNQWQTDIDAVTQAFADNFQLLTLAQLNWKPQADVWSVAQNIDHLMVINTTYYPVIKKLREGNYPLPWHARIGWLVRWFGSVILKSVSPDRRRKMKTFPLWEPNKSDLPASIIDDFKKHQSELKDLIDSCSDLIAAGAVICSPANRSIVYTLETAFDIIVTHEKRHLQQAIEVNSARPK